MVKQRSITSFNWKCEGIGKTQLYFSFHLHCIVTCNHKENSRGLTPAVAHMHVINNVLIYGGRAVVRVHTLNLHTYQYFGDHATELENRSTGSMQQLLFFLLSGWYRTGHLVGPFQGPSLVRQLLLEALHTPLSKSTVLGCAPRPESASFLSRSFCFASCRWNKCFLDWLKS